MDEDRREKALALFDSLSEEDRRAVLELARKIKEGEAKGKAVSELDTASVIHSKGSAS